MGECMLESDMAAWAYLVVCNERIGVQGLYLSCFLLGLRLQSALGDGGREGGAAVHAAAWPIAEVRLRTVHTAGLVEGDQRAEAAVPSHVVLRLVDLLKG